MPGIINTRLQTALVIVLFAGSLTVLVSNTYQVLLLPQAEDRARELLRDASRQMAAAADETVLTARTGSELKAHAANLRAIAARVLAGFPGVEGGFYVAAGVDRFLGYAHPTAPPDLPVASSRDEPPPLETPMILAQARQSLTLVPGEYGVDVRDIGPSRVAVLTEAVGSERPARLATWTMYRLINPEQLRHQVRQNRLSAGLALGGVALALVLTVGLGRNLRRQRHQEERLRQELRRAEHLAALGTLLAGVAHEVRNPLAAIRSTVQLWQRLPDTARTPESIDAVVQAVDRINAIVTRLVYFARAESLERKPVSVNQVLIETLELVKAQTAEQGVTLELDLAANLPSVEGSAGALRQVILNLAINALQAMPQGGRLHVTTRLDAPARMVEIRVRDTGPGIAAEHCQHLFEPFFTTRSDGTGLGLALCRQIVLDHGGRIEFLADQAPGTTFRVLLPRPAPPP